MKMANNVYVIDIDSVLVLNFTFVLGTQIS